MPSDLSDLISGIVSSTSRLLLLDAPKRTAYGVVLGIFLYALYILASAFLELPKDLPWYIFVIFGQFIIHARTIFLYIRGQPNVSEKYAEQFEVIRRAEKAGLSKAHIKLQLFALCRAALDEATIDEETRKELIKLQRGASKDA